LTALLIVLGVSVLALSSSAAAQSADALGTRWDVTEYGQTAVWTRRGTSNVFDGVWTPPGRPSVRAVLTITISGTSVSVQRRQSSDFPDNDCDYTGTLAPDFATVIGTSYRCTRFRPYDSNWRATIYGRASSLPQPNQPDGSLAITCNGGALTVTWSAYLGASDYWLQVSTSPERGGPGTTRSFVSVTGEPSWNSRVGNVTSKTLTGARGGTTYYTVVDPYVSGTSQGTYATMSSVTCPNSPQPGRLQVVRPLSLSSTSPRVGDLVTARFTVRNVGDQDVAVQSLTAAARRGDDWNGQWADFPNESNFTVRPGAEHTYTGWRSFDTAGRHFAEPAVQLNGTWGGVGSSNHVQFEVRPALGEPVSVTGIARCGPDDSLNCGFVRLIAEGFEQEDGPNWYGRYYFRDVPSNQWASLTIGNRVSSDNNSGEWSCTFSVYIDDPLFGEVDFGSHRVKDIDGIKTCE
jgi:hypothetical protein